MTFSPACGIVTVVADPKPERLLAHAVMWGHPSAELLEAIRPTDIADEWCRMVVSAVIVLRSEGEPITLRTVSALLDEAGVEFHVADLVMSDVVSDSLDPLLSEDAAAVAWRHVEVEAERRRLREALIQAADALEGAGDPSRVSAALVKAVTP